MESKIEALRQAIDAFHRRYNKLKIRCAYEAKIDFYFIEVTNEDVYSDNMSYYDDIFNLNKILFQKLETYDILLSGPSSIMKMDQNEILFSIEPYYYTISTMTSNPITSRFRLKKKSKSEFKSSNLSIAAY